MACGANIKREDSGSHGTLTIATTKSSSKLLRYLLSLRVIALRELQVRFIFVLTTVAKFFATQDIGNNDDPPTRNADEAIVLRESIHLIQLGLSPTFVTNFPVSSGKTHWYTVTIGSRKRSIPLPSLDQK